MLIVMNFASILESAKGALSTTFESVSSFASSLKNFRLEAVAEGAFKGISDIANNIAQSTEVFRSNASEALQSGLMAAREAAGTLPDSWDTWKGILDAKNHALGKLHKLAETKSLKDSVQVAFEMVGLGGAGALAGKVVKQTMKTFDELRLEIGKKLPGSKSGGGSSAPSAAKPAPGGKKPPVAGAPA
jgi:hypothetical protein